MGVLLVVLLLLLLFAAIPAWPYSRPYGYYPSGALFVVLIVVLVLLIVGVIPHGHWW